ncbi:MAG TPA: M28 family peptidase, partial [Anaerolineae bacterium]|nr:M28 family peptidase [Anaerolineae bacterium]
FKMGLVFFFALSLLIGIVTSTQPVNEHRAKTVKKFSNSDSSNSESTATNSESTITGSDSTATVNSDPAPASFDADRALDHIRYVSGTIGPRPAGGKNERLVSEYVKEKLGECGYDAAIQKLVLPNGQHSYNVVASLPGRDEKSIILGAHIDSRGGPGANDNASGVGVLLELARVASSRTDLPYSLHFVFFGAEEKVGKDARDHHFGSRHYVYHMSGEQKNTTFAMVNIDMVGVGSKLYARSLKAEPGPIANNLLKLADDLNIKLSYKQAGDIADFEAFEHSGIDSAWLEWREDPNYHSPKDTHDKISRSDLISAGVLLQEFLLRGQR